jgi:hypothetical protein
VKRLALGLALVSLMLVPPASATNFGPVGGGVRFGNDYRHYFYYQNLGATWSSATTAVRRIALDPTAIDSALTGHSSSDVAVLQVAVDDTWSGHVDCQWDLGQVCIHNHIRYNTTIKHGSDMSRQSTACNEIGHTVGLRHPATQERFTCMASSRFTNNFDQHDRDHINNHYGWHGYYRAAAYPVPAPTAPGGGSFCNHGWEPECTEVPPAPPPSSPSPPPPAPPAPPPQAAVLTDGFETGNFSRWTTNNGLVSQQQEVYVGSWAARGTTTGSARWAYRTLSTTYTDLCFGIRFKIISQGSSSTVNLMKFRTATGIAIFGLHRHWGGNLGIRNEVAGYHTTGSTPVDTGTWHTVGARVRVNGTAGETEIWLDGVRLADLSRTENLGTTPIGRLQIGENSPDRTYDVAIDEALATTSCPGQ